LSKLSQIRYLSLRGIKFSESNQLNSSNSINSGKIATLLFYNQLIEAQKTMENETILITAEKRNDFEKWFKKQLKNKLYIALAELGDIAYIHHDCKTTLKYYLQAMKQSNIQLQNKYRTRAFQDCIKQVSSERREKPN
jgi:hypothetical protein